jgi:hypothetical protein
MIEDVFSKLAPILGGKAERLWLLYKTETDLEKRREIEGIVYSLAAKHLDENYQNNKILLPPPINKNGKGYLLGTVFYGDQSREDFYLPEKELLLHCAILGATGTGKTNCGLLLVKQLMEKELPYMIFDWKRNYRDLLDTDWAKDKEVKIFTVGREVVPFSFDPLFPPPGTDWQTWQFKAIDILCHSHFLGHGVRYLLKILLDATDEHSLHSLLSALHKTKAVGRRRQWLDSAIRAVGDLCLGNTGRVFNSTPHANLEELLSKNVVFELDALHDDAKTFFIEIMLAWIHQYRLNQSMREIIKHVILIEEAHHILLKRKEYQAEKETVMDVIFREIRELGEALIVIDQHPSLVSKPALGNTGTTILMRLKHADDVRAGADCTLLDLKQRDYLGRLQTGWAIVKAPNIDRPFLLKVPYIDVEKGKIDDETVIRLIEPYDIIPTVRDWHLIARSDSIFKTFLVENIKEIKVLDQRFQRNPSYDVTDLFRRSFEYWSGGKEIEVVLQFKKRVASIIKNGIWSEDQEMKTLPNGSIILATKVNSLEEIGNWVMTWGGNVKVLQPERLRRHVVKKANGLAKTNKA